jgi:hypothetical protein
VSLVVYLEKRLIHSVGTVRLNRLRGLPGPVEADMKKNGRGTSCEYISIVDGVEVSCVRWYDNKLVSLISTFAGTQPVAKVKRWSKKEKAQLEIDCPNIVGIYNKHMGGVDTLDSIMGLYRIHVRSKKYYHRIFFHLLDMAVANAWLLYRRAHSQLDGMQPKFLVLADFKADIAEGNACCSVQDPTTS